MEVRVRGQHTAMPPRTEILGSEDDVVNNMGTPNELDIWRRWASVMLFQVHCLGLLSSYTRTLHSDSAYRAFAGGVLSGACLSDFRYI